MLAWLGLMLLGGMLPLDPAWAYAFRTIAVLALLGVLRPWRWYGPLPLGHLPLALLTGVAVFALWVLPEAWGYESALARTYGRWLVLPLGSVPDARPGMVYSPPQCGWMLTTLRLLGSGLVIAVAEEYFWRGFLYRWLIARDFLSVKLSVRDWEATAWMTVLFAAEHHRFLAGALAGLAYLELMRRTRSLHAAVLAHIVTNLLLGVYVVITRSYQFW
jgi:CAAX prenyl protease-like protein